MSRGGPGTMEATDRTMQPDLPLGARLLRKSLSGLNAKTLNH